MAAESQEYTNQLGQALGSIPTEEEAKENDGLIHLSSGVVLAPKKVNPFVFQEIVSKFKDPPVPVYYNDDKGREEPNPMHPDYLKGLAEADTNRGMAAMDASIALGTRLVSVPDGFGDPNDDEWLDDLESVGISFDRSNTRLRYRTWVKYVAAQTVDDIQLLMSIAYKAVGITEEAVTTAAANFQPKT